MSKHNTLYLITSIAFTFILLESILWFLGYTPGKLERFWSLGDTKNYNAVDFFETSEEGVLKLSKNVILASRKVNKNNKAIEILHFEGITEIITNFDSLYNLIKENDESQFISKIKNTSWESEFTTAAFKSIKNRTIDATLYENYLKNPINDDGFRSIDFNQEDNSKKRVLLIGDSFGWGMSASPIFNSFADVLLARGYLVFNTGIPGTDPAQYFAIVKEYVEKIKPDVIVVNLCLGNDLMVFERPPRKNEPLEHLINGNFIESNPLGSYLEEDSAIKFYDNLSKIPDNSIFNKVCASSRVLTKVWHTLYEFNLVEHETRTKYFKIRESSIIVRAHLTKKYFSQIKQLCTLNNIPLLNMVIPGTPQVSQKPSILTNYQRKALKILYNKEDYFYLKNLYLSDFEEGGGHYNNSGSLKHASLIDSLLKSLD